MNNHLHQMTGLWLIESQAGNELVSLASTVNQDAASLQARSQRANAVRTHRVDNGDIAMLQLRGPLTKHSNSLGTMTSTTLFRRDLQAAARDPDIGGILVVVESPGGTSAGTYESAAGVRQAAALKPVHVYCEDLCASAAFWIASAAQHISANTMCRTGSIGTYAVVRDTSQAALARGIQTHLVSTGPYKGMGAAGTPISPLHLAEIREHVESTNAHFLAAVAKGRNLPLARVQQLADGRLFDAAKANDLKLIDSVETFEQAFERLEHTVATKRRTA